MNIKFIEENYDLQLKNMQLLDSHFGTEIYLIIADSGKFIAKVMPMSIEADNEGPVTEYLRGCGMSVPKFQRNLRGEYVTKTAELQLTIQSYIEGKVLPLNSVPDWFMVRSAEFLGKTVSFLRGYGELPLRFGEDFFSPENAKKKARQYLADSTTLKENGDFETALLFDDQVRHLLKISELGIDTERLTYSASHGDYHIGQVIVRDGDLSVIDWSSVCRLPICLELATSYAFASPACADGTIDAKGLKEYILIFEKYATLSEYDIKAMPYVLYFWHCMCNYSPYEHADMAESYRPVARLIHKMLGWLFEHVDELSDELYGQN